MKYLLLFFLLLTPALAAEDYCAVDQYNLDLYFMFCMDHYLLKCREIGADPLLTTCGSKVGLLCREAVHEYETKKYNECQQALSPPVEPSKSE